MKKDFAEDGSNAHLSEAKIKELRRRKEKYLKNRGSGCTWEQVKNRARTTFR